MRVIGDAFTFIGIGTWVITGIWGFFLCLGIISDAAGFWGIVGALLLGPVTFVAAPLYAGFSLGDWFPFLLGYGGGFGSLILISIGSAINGK